MREREKLEKPHRFNSLSLSQGLPRNRAGRRGVSRSEEGIRVLPIAFQNLRFLDLAKFSSNSLSLLHASLDSFLSSRSPD